MNPIPKPIKEIKARRKWWKKKPKKDLGLPVSKSKLIKNDCLNLWFEIIHLIYNETCAACGRIGGCSGHHFFGQKAYPSVKFDLDNGVLLCIGCHIMKVHRKGQTEIARDALIMRIGIDRFEALKKRANSPRKYPMQELLALRDSLKLAKLNSQ